MKSSRKASSSSLAAALACAAALAAPGDAWACSYPAPPPVLKGVPADTARDVRTDVVPVYSLYDAQLQPEGAVVEVTSSDGRSIAASFRVSFGFLEVVPRDRLDPLTTYSVHIHGRSSYSTEESPEPDIDLTTSFTTGAGPVMSRPPPPVVTMHHYSDYPSQTTCSPDRNATCLGVAADAVFQLVFNPSPYTSWIHGPSWHNLTGIYQGTPFECVDVSMRGENGVFGEAVTLCGKDAPMFSLRDGGELSCTSTGLKVNGELPWSASTVGASGCAFAGRPSRSAGVALLATLGLAALGRFASRRRSRSGR